MAALLVGCAEWRIPRTVVISEAELGQRLASRFPIDKQLLEVLQVHVDAPELRLLPEQDRLAIAFRLRIRDRLSAQLTEARVSLGAALRLQASDHTVRLREVVVTGWGAERGGTAPNAIVQRVGRALIESAVEGAVVYTFKPDQLEQLARAGLQPGLLKIGTGGLTLHLEPRSPSAVPATTNTPV